MCVTETVIAREQILAADSFNLRIGWVWIGRKKCMLWYKVSSPYKPIRRMYNSLIGLEHEKSKVRTCRGCAKVTWGLRAKTNNSV